MTIFFQNKDQYFTSIDMAKFVDFDEQDSGRPSFLTSYVISKIRQIKNYTTITITDELLEAPDFVSFRNYQRSHSYWWIIMVYNDILEFSEFTFGKQIKIPNITEINQILSGLQLAETSVKNVNYDNIFLVK